MNYKIGLDIGIASVGWTTLLLNEQDEPMKILDMGSRIFDTAEVAKTGASLALARRMARGSRRRLRRHTHRIDRIKYLFEKKNIIKIDQIQDLYDGVVYEKDVYAIRYDALNRKLNTDEFVRLLIHLAQRRGFKSNRKIDAAVDKETGKLTTAVSENKELLLKKEYRTIGEMLFKDEKFAKNKRNKSESYSNTFARDMLVDEIKIIFECQRKLGNQYATEDFEKEYLNIYESQRSFEEGPGGDSKYGGNQIEKMIGKCTFEKKESRGLKAQYTIEYTSMLEKINSIKIFTVKEKRELSKEENLKIRNLFFEKINVTYADIRKIINMNEEATFNISYGDKPIKEIETKTKLNYMKAYHVIKKAFGTSFKYISLEKLDVLGYVLTVYKNDEKIAKILATNGFSDDEIKIALTIPAFAKTANLSVKACKKLLPFLEDGLTYDKACDAAGYAFKADDFDEKRKLLPANPTIAPELDDIKNPVVRRAISQTIKVVNNIIRKYDESPTFLSVELARELSNDFDERRKIEKEQNENHAKNEEMLELIKKENPYFKKVNGQDILKLKLWQAQDGICPYSQKPILRDKLFEIGYVDIDHIIPFSICFNDSYKNKVLTFASENRQKGNRLPMQYLSGKKQDDFVVWVNNNIHERTKKSNLLKADFTVEDETEWKSRNLNDTKYISTFMFNYINKYLLFAPNHTNRKKTVMSVNGAVTNYMRKRWGITKIREDGDKHHCLDAAVIACVTDGMIKRISEYSKYNETKYTKDASLDVSFDVDKKTGEIIDRFPFPYETFREELRIRMSDNPQRELDLSPLRNYDSDEIVNPIFVSRVANRKIGGEAHGATARTQKEIEGDFYTVAKVPLTSLVLDKNGDVATKDAKYYNPSSDKLLYDALKRRLLIFNGDGKKAFEEPFYKPLSTHSNGENGPTLVKKVKVMQKATAGVSIQQGTAVADNSSMIRVDVFHVEKEGYYLVPIYVADVLKKEIPNKAILQAKPMSQWKEMSDDNFIFSLYPKDLIKVTAKKEMKFSLVNETGTLPKEMIAKEMLCYYVSTGISSATIHVINNDNTYKISSMGVKTLPLLEKYQVDVLGNYSKVENEKRQYFND